MVVHSVVKKFLSILSGWMVVVGMGVPVNLEPPISLAPAPRAQSAKVTWYSLPHRFTASGKRMNPKKMHTAHKTLPFGTIVELVGDNGTTIYVEVTDRGPYDSKNPMKQFDLTPAAFQALGHQLGKGVADVRWRVIHRPKVHDIQAKTLEV